MITKSCKRIRFKATTGTGKCSRVGLENNCSVNEFSEVELEIAQELLGLSSAYSWGWGCKRRRSEPSSNAAVISCLRKIEGLSSRHPISPLDIIPKVSTTQTSRVSQEVLKKECDILVNGKKKPTTNVTDAPSFCDQDPTENLITKVKRRKLTTVDLPPVPKDFGEQQEQVIHSNVDVGGSSPAMCFHKKARGSVLGSRIPSSPYYQLTFSISNFSLEEYCATEWSIFHRKILAKERRRYRVHMLRRHRTSRKFMDTL